MYIKMVDN